MNKNPIATYHDVYHYFELYEDYIQIHQSEGTIPYPAILKKDGEKFYFDDLKKATFLRGHSGNEKGLVDGSTGMAFFCTLHFTKKKIKIKSFLHESGWGQQDKLDSFRLFMDMLIPVLQKKKIKIYGLTGLPSRLSKHLKLKIGGVTLGSSFLITFLADIVLGTFLESLHDSYGLVNMAIFAAVFMALFVSINLFFDKGLQKKITWKEVIREYIPPLSLEKQQELAAFKKNQ